MNFLKGALLLETTKKVNCIKQRCKYKARDKEELIRLIIQLHDEGYSQVDIAKQLGVSRGTIKRWNDELHFFTPRTPGEAGKLKNKIHPYDEHYFQAIRTPNQAYMVGFITGDGTIQDNGKSKRLTITLAEKDHQILDDMAAELNMQHAVKFKISKKVNEQNKYSLTLHSTQICNDLIAMGITPRKTGHEQWVDFQSDALQWAYIRGFFDADGHARVFTYKGYLAERLGFTSGELILRDLLAFFQVHGYATKINKIVKKKGCYELRLGSVREIREITSKMYEHGTLKLNRKFKILSSLMI